MDIIIVGLAMKVKMKWNTVILQTWWMFISKHNKQTKSFTVFEVQDDW